MRRPALDIGTASRAVGFVALAATIVATAVHVRHDQIGAGARVGSAATSVQSDPLARELARCQAIGMAAKDDGPCEAAWAENRRRFLTYRQPMEASPAVARPFATPTADR
ncbi:MAG TPA: putative entry exclusion protein TrbK-alt [Candidatus Binataceae bacterium]|nr:putative entry exclusion protein TrbK-alt [Candidatus Binataceae bacterium]